MPAEPVCVILDRLQDYAGVPEVAALLAEHKAAQRDGRLLTYAPLTGALLAPTLTAWIQELPLYLGHLPVR